MVATRTPSLSTFTRAAAQRLAEQIRLWPTSDAAEKSASHRFLAVHVDRILADQPDTETRDNDLVSGLTHRVHNVLRTIAGPSIGNELFNGVCFVVERREAQVIVTVTQRPVAH